MVNGIWGTLSVGLFAQDKIVATATGSGLFFGGGSTLFLAQLKGVLAVGAFTFVGALIAWGLIKLVLGLRVTEEEEREGLDLGEHGNMAYPDFQSATGHI